MAIFGRMTARQRLRRATRESLSIPAFSSPVDCTPWVTGGLWPAELSTVTPETATLAEYLKADLQRIANGANDELRKLKRAGMTDTARQAAEARVIEQARARAVRRVESTIRCLHAVQSGARPPALLPPTLGAPGADLERTQVLPAVGDAEHTASPPAQQTPEARPRLTRRRAAEEPADSGRHHAPADRDEPATESQPAVADAETA